MKPRLQQLRRQRSKRRRVGFLCRAVIRYQVWYCTETLFVLPQITAEAPAPAPAPVVEEKKVEEAPVAPAPEPTPVVEEKKVEEAPAAPAPAPVVEEKKVEEAPAVPAPVSEAPKDIPGALGAVKGEAAGGKVLPKETVSAETLDFLKVKTAISVITIFSISWRVLVDGAHLTFFLSQNYQK